MDDDDGDGDGMRKYHITRENLPNKHYDKEHNYVNIILNLQFCPYN